MTRNVAIKISTTGLAVKDKEGQPHRLTEICAIELIDGQKGEVFQRFINPGRNIDPITHKYNRVSEQKLKSSPTFPEIVSDLISFIGSDCPIFFIPHFVRQFLRTEIELLNDTSLQALSSEQKQNLAQLCAKGNFINVLQLAKLKLPELKNHRLQTIAEHYNIDDPLKTVKRCQAELDCETLVGVYQKLNGIVPKSQLQTASSIEQSIGQTLFAQHGVLTRAAKQRLLADAQEAREDKDSGSQMHACI